MDLGIHCVDLLRYLCGEVTEVMAMVDTLSAENLASDSPVEGTANLLLKMGNGSQAVITSYWSAATFEPQRANGLEISGTLGTIQATPIQSKNSSGTLRLLTGAGEQNFSVGPGGLRPHVALLEDLAKAIAAGTPSTIPGEEGLTGLRVIEAAHRSARTGRWIILD